MNKFVPYDIICRTGHVLPYCRVQYSVKCVPSDIFLVFSHECPVRHNVPYDIFDALYNISQWWCLRSLMAIFNHITSSIYYYHLIKNKKFLNISSFNLYYISYFIWNSDSSRTTYFDVPYDILH